MPVPTTLTIDNKDVSNVINRYSYTVQFDMREGVNGGKTLDGSLLTDMLARKVVISFTTRVGANVDSLLSSILDKKSVAVSYMRPGCSNRCSANFCPEIGSFQVALFNGENIIWQESAQITLTEI